MAKNGKKIILLAGGVAVAATKTDDIKTSVETIPSSSPNVGPWKTHVKKRKEWKVTTSYLVTDTSALSVAGGSGLKDLLQIGNDFVLIIRDADGEDLGVTGTATLTQAHITASLGKLVQGNFEFEGNGPLTAIEEDNSGGLE